MAAYEAFFKYLRDEQEDNVRWLTTEGGYEFEILQGSKRVSGTANAQKFIAEARIVKAQNLSVTVMRRLVESNFSLEYCRYALDNDNNLVVKFDSNALDASPFKLYYALKELAVNADKQDDLLLDEFGMQLMPIDMGSKTDLPDAEREIKYTFLIDKITALFAEIHFGQRRYWLFLLNSLNGISHFFTQAWCNLALRVKRSNYTPEPQAQDAAHQQSGYSFRR